MSVTVSARVSFGSHPPQGLILCTSLLDLDDLHANLASMAGTGTDSWIATSVAGTPVPDYDLRDADGRWPGFAAGVMWHPLMWLPADITERRPIEVEGGGQVEETDEILAVRLILAAMACGLYDPADATWLDVLSTVGLDRHSPQDLELVETWLAGGDVPALDKVDLSDLLQLTAEVQSTAASIVEVVEDAALAVGATELSALVDALFDPDAGRDEVVLRSSVVALLELYRDLTPWWFAGEVDETIQSVRMATSAAHGADAVTKWLGSVTAHYSPSLDLVHRELAGATGEPG